MIETENIIERREFIRIPKKLPVELTELTQDNKYQKKERFFNVKSKNISIGGMCIDFPYKEFPFSRKSVQLNINIPEKNILINLSAEVVWSRKRHRLLGGYDLGVKFTKIENQIKDLLSTYVQQSPVQEKRGISKWVEFLIYRVILKNILQLSKLGKNSIRGNADSGLNFDHMYKNKPVGSTLFGRSLDKILLNLPAVKATRNRKMNILKILLNEVENNILLGKKTRILDLASGPSRYLNELITNEYKNHIEALCLDKDIVSLKEGRKLAEGKPVRYLRADILKLEHLMKFSEKASWKPNIVIVSGLYVYIEDNLVKKSLEDIFESLEKDGLIIFCSQLDNPSKKLMAKVCTIHTGDSWRLFYRTPRQIRRLMIELGYKYNIVSLDPIGMYELCTGRKV